MNTTTDTVSEVVFLVTVWVIGTDSRTFSHQRAFLSMEATMAYITALDPKCRAEVRTMTPGEIFGEYSELVRNARTAGLVRDGMVTDHTNTYIIPEGAIAAASSYKRLAGACEALMSGTKARGKRAELESIHDRARRIAGLMSDLDAAN
jgi:hypothetical protein